MHWVFGNDFSWGEFTRVVIIGGGIAGIAAAWESRKTGAEVILLEARPRLGGRLTSHNLQDSPTPFDNGPHLFLSTYTRSLRLFRELEIAEDFTFPYPGKIHFIRGDGWRGALREWSLPAPFNLAAGLMSFPLLSWKERRRTLKAAQELLHRLPPESQSAKDWLASRSDQEEREIFWHPLIQAALNAPSDAVPTTYLSVIFRQGFCNGFRGGRLGHALRPLGEIFGEKVQGKLESVGVEVRLKTSVWGLRLGSGDKPKITGVFVGKNETVPCDAVVATLPPWTLSDWTAFQFIELNGQSATSPLQSPQLLEGWQANPIVTIYLWAENRPLLETYTSLPGRSVSWVFDYARLWNDRRAPLALMLAGQADVSMRDNLSRKAGNGMQSRFPLDVERIFTDLFSAFPQLRPVIWKAWKIIRERRATPLRPMSTWGKKLQQMTAIPNLFLAGDWLDPELPPTVEAAVRTGIRIKNYMQKIALDF